jgi:hypothetical protein
MPLHLYCILPAGHAVPDDCAGIERRRPLAVNAGSHDIWATEHDRAIAPSVDVIRTHNVVVSAAMDRRVTPVPLRFGQSARDREAAVRHVSEEAKRWLGLLTRFAGRAEYGIRAVRDVPPAEQDVHPARAESGTAYMAALARRQAQATQRRTEGERIAEGIASCTGVAAEDTRVEVAPAGDVLVSVVHLVAWADVEAYHGAIREMRETSQTTRFVLTGPWPPYSFVE